MNQIWDGGDVSTTSLYFFVENSHPSKSLIAFLYRTRWLLIQISIYAELIPYEFDYILML